jgi:predicted phosphohydrolase
MINVYAISDLHLSGRIPFKNMEEFGAQYAGYMARIESGFRSLPSGSVVINAGDTSWAIRRDEALIDFRWLDSFGVKIVHTMGNHDYYWGKKGAAFMSGWALDNGLQNTYFADHQQLFTIGYKGLTVAAVRGVERFTPTGGEHWTGSGVHEPFPVEMLPAGHREVAGEVTPRSWEKYMRRLEAALALYPDILVVHIPPFDHQGEFNELTEKIVSTGAVKMVVYGHRHNTPYTPRCNQFVDNIFWVNALAERNDFTPVPLGVTNEEGMSEISVRGNSASRVGVITETQYIIEGGMNKS